MHHLPEPNLINFRRNIFFSDLQIVGTISKQYSGLVHEALTDAENFIVIFPIDLDVKIKAALIATVFIIVILIFKGTSALNPTIKKIQSFFLL